MLHHRVWRVRLEHADGGFTTVVTPSGTGYPVVAVAKVEQFVSAELARGRLAERLADVGLVYRGAVRTDR